MRILITGAGGFIGRALVELLVSKKHQIIAFDNNSRGNLQTLSQSKYIKTVKGDICDYQAVVDVSEDIDAIYHLAYINGTKNFYSIPDKVLEVGIIGTHNVLKACLKNNVPNFFLASSSEVYQSAEQIPTPESIDLKIPDVCNPRYSYGGGKVACELLTLNYLRNSSVKYSIFRPHNVYGPEMGFEHVLPDLIKKIYYAQAVKKSGEINIKVQGSGDQTRSFIYIDDAVRAIELCTIQNTTEDIIFHVGTMNEISIKNLVSVLGKVCDIDIAITASESPRGGTTRRCPDTARLKALGFKETLTLEEGVRNTVEWYWNFYTS